MNEPLIDPSTITESSDASKPNDTLIAAVLIAIALFLSVFVLWEFTKPRGGEVILPGGITYLGPNRYEAPKNVTPTPRPLITAQHDAVWKTLRLKEHPITISYPETMNLTRYPNAASETVVIRDSSTNTAEYLFLNVLDLNKGSFQLYKGKPKRDIVANFDTLTVGVKSVSAIRTFTNAGGLVGYRANVESHSGIVTDEVFFEAPDNLARMIHITNSILEPKLYDRMIDSIRWEGK